MVKVKKSLLPLFFHVPPKGFWRMFSMLSTHTTINPRTYTQIHTSTMVQGVRGGGGELEGTPPGVFDVLQYFETILPSVESL